MARKVNRSPRANKGFYVFSSILFGSIVALLTAELALRVSGVWIGRHSDTMFTIMEHDRVLGWKMKPNFNGFIDLVDIENIPVTSNSTGFRDKEFVVRKPSNRCRILFLGDSFTWGLGVREEERFTNLLSSAAPEWESLNFGIPAYGTDQSLLLWQQTAYRYQPDLVVLTIYKNDYVENMNLVRYGRRKPYFELNEGKGLELKGVPVDNTVFWDDGIFNQIAPPYASFFRHPVQKRSRIMQWFAKKSDLARYFYTLLRIRNIADTKHNRPKPDKLNGGTRSDTAEVADSSGLTNIQLLQVRLLYAQVAKLAKEVEASGANFLVVFSGDLIPQYEMQKKIFSDNDIMHINATTPVLERIITDNSRIYYKYNGHWTSASHKAVSRVLTKSIQEQKLCKM